MLILAFDLAKHNSVACLFNADTTECRFRTIRTEPQPMHDLIAEWHPHRVVIEIGPPAGWVKDLVEALGIEIEVANPNHEAWRWQRVKRKTDRDDAVKLARLSAMGQLPTVHVPSARTRQWRALIRHRQSLIEQRTAIKNQIHALLVRHALRLSTARAWSPDWLAALRTLARPLAECPVDELWRGQLTLLLEQYAQLQAWVDEVQAKLDALGQADERVRRLRRIPGVGPRLAEALVATLDDPRRFKNGREVGAYVGLVPRQFQSGGSDRRGRITGQGNALLRTLLVEVAWIGRRFNDWMRRTYEQIRRGSDTRKRIAIVALARRLLVRCWAMLRDGTEWREPEMTAV